MIWRSLLSKLVFLAVSIGVLGGVDTFLTATILPIPVWVTFIAWASFFACGGGATGLVRSILSNWTGIIIATLSLVAISVLPATPIFAAISVGTGSGLMILVSASPRLGFPPATVFGFAAMVGTVAATGHAVTDMGITHPTLIAAFSMLVGAACGCGPAAVANLLT